MTGGYRLHEKHDPSWRCDDYHCYSCGVDELRIGKPYRVCGECFHVYPTRFALCRDRRRTMRPIYHDEVKTFLRHPTRRYWDDTLWQRGMFIAKSLVSLYFRRARHIYTCPRCAHDF